MQVSSMSRTLRHFKAVNQNIIRTVAVSAVKEDVRSWAEVPGPSALPIIGIVHHFLPGGAFQDMSKLQENLYKAFGPIVKLKGMFGTENSIFLYDPECAAQILRSENWMPIRPGLNSLNHYREVYRKSEHPDSPNGLLTDHGEKWKKMRTMANPILMHPKIIKLYTKRLDEIAGEMVESLKTKRDENNMVRDKLDHHMHLWALESIGLVSLGCRLNCFDPNLPEDSPENQLIRCVVATFEGSFELDFKPNLSKYFSTPKFRKVMKLYTEHERLAKFFIRRSMDEARNSQNSDEDEKAVLLKLFEIDEEATYVLGTDMLFAGIDTTANAVLAAMYYLASNPEKQEKLRQELNSQSEQKIYLKACIKEALRLIPVAVGNVRMSTKEYDMLGYRIPKDTLVLIAHQTMSVMEEHFSRPKEFIPERWIDKESPIYNNAHPYVFQPFGFGVRTCIGRRIADLEIEILITKIMQTFQVDWIGPPPKVVMKPINTVMGPYNFIFKDI